MLKRMASSRIIGLDFKADAVPAVRFAAGRGARETLIRYLRARLLTIDVGDQRQRDRGAGPHIIEVHVGIVLRHEPNG